MVELPFRNSLIFIIIFSVSSLIAIPILGQEEREEKLVTNDQILESLDNCSKGNPSLPPAIAFGLCKTMFELSDYTCQKEYRPACFDSRYNIFSELSDDEKASPSSLSMSSDNKNDGDRDKDDKDNNEDSEDNKDDDEEN